METVVPDLRLADGHLAGHEQASILLIRSNAPYGFQPLLHVFAPAMA
jgi:hypothetical protein